jgi:hypothetical protein
MVPQELIDQVCEAFPEGSIIQYSSVDVHGQAVTVVAKVVGIGASGGLAVKSPIDVPDYCAYPIHPAYALQYATVIG